MRRVLCSMLGLSLLAAGCTTVRVDYSMKSVGPVLVLQALKDDDPIEHTHGYLFQVLQGNRHVGTYVSKSDEPILLRDIPPGRYQIQITGRRIDPEQVEVNLVHGSHVTVSLLTWNAKRAARAAAIGEWMGKAFLYTVFSIAYITFEVFWYWLFDCDDDDDDDCDD